MDNSIYYYPEWLESLIASGTLLITSATAIVIIGYWFRPSFKISLEKDHTLSNHIRITVFNTNFFGNSIKDIDCEFTFADDENFSGEVRTLELIIPWIVCLKRKPAFYIFKADLNTVIYPNNDISGMKFLRIRLLAPNFLGIKKVNESIFKI